MVLHLLACPIKVRRQGGDRGRAPWLPSRWSTAAPPRSWPRGGSTGAPGLDGAAPAHGEAVARAADGMARAKGLPASWAGRAGRSAGGTRSGRSWTANIAGGTRRTRATAQAESSPTDPWCTACQCRPWSHQFRGDAAWLASESSRACARPGAPAAALPARPQEPCEAGSVDRPRPAPPSTRTPGDTSRLAPPRRHESPPT